MVRALRRYWALALVVALTAVAVVVSALALAPRTYTATSVVAMVPRPEPRASGDVLRLTIPTYSTLATSQRVAADLADRFQEDVDSILAAVTAENPPSSNTILLSAAWGDPEGAAEIANGLADEVIEAAATDPLLTGSLVAAAVPPTQASWPPQQAGLVLGALLAVGLGVAAAMVADRRRPLVSSPADVVRLVEENHLDVPVLITGTAVSGTAEVLARTVEDRLAASGPGRSPHLEFATVAPSTSTSPSRTVALAVSAAAALSRRGRRVLVCLEEDERVLVEQPDLARESAYATPGQVILGASPGEPPTRGIGDGGAEPEPVDLTVRLVRGTEQSEEGTLPTSSLGVVATVVPNTSSDHVRAVLHGLGDRGIPVLAVCYLVDCPAESVPAPA
jgi:capsular polysaccharide biosynthesis protein